MRRNPKLTALLHAGMSLLIQCVAMRRALATYQPDDDAAAILTLRLIEAEQGLCLVRGSVRRELR